MLRVSIGVRLAGMSKERTCCAHIACKVFLKMGTLMSDKLMEYCRNPRHVEDEEATRECSSKVESLS